MLYLATIATMAQTPGLDSCGPIYFADGADSNGAGQIQLLLNGTFDGCASKAASLAAYLGIQQNSIGLTNTYGVHGFIFDTIHFADGSCDRGVADERAAITALNAKFPAAGPAAFASSECPSDGPDVPGDPGCCIGLQCTPDPTNSSRCSAQPNATNVVKLLNVNLEAMCKTYPTAPGCAALPPPPPGKTNNTQANK
jgi:hypothetical protein